MQVAEVYPLLRLPRHFSVFDYLVPPNLTLSRGDWVKIPFRNQELLGVVKEIHERFSPRKNLKTIKEKLNLHQLTEEEFSFFTWLANETVQSIPSVLYAAVPTPPKHFAEKEKKIPIPLTIKASEINTLQRTLRFIEEKHEGFIMVGDLPKMAALTAAYAHSHINDQIAILVPSPREAEILAPRLSSFSLSLLTGQETEGQRFRAWSLFREKKTRILLGTRLASLLIPNKVDAFFVFRSSHESYKQWDQNPRYDARDNICWWQKKNNSRLFFLDTLPRLNDLIIFKPNQLFLEVPPTSLPKLLDFKAERLGSPHPLLTYSVSQMIENCLTTKRRVLCFYNRKGQATSLGCRDCGFTFPCSRCGGIFTVYETTVHCHHCRTIEPLPFSCPNCQGSRLRERGFGNRAIKLALQKLFPEATVSIIDRGCQEDLSADILLVTSFYFEAIHDPFLKNNLGLIINLDADLPLLEANISSLDNALRLIEELRALALREQALFVAQTRTPEIFNKYYADPIAYWQEEIKRRQDYQDPPFVRIMKITNKEIDARRAVFELENLAAGLKIFSGLAISWRGQKNKERKELILTMKNDIVKGVLNKLSSLPDNFIIDTNLIL